MICTCQREHAAPRLSTYDFHIPPTDGASASGRHLDTVHLWQAHGFKLNASVGAIMAHNMSGRHRYFHASANKYKLLTSPLPLQGRSLWTEATVPWPTGLLRHRCALWTSVLPIQGHFFGLESYLVQPTIGTGRAFTSIHMPMSASPVSNVPGHVGPNNFISSPRAVPRDWWTIGWLACEGCCTRPIAWCQLLWTLTRLSLTHWPFAKAGRLSLHWTLKKEDAENAANHMLSMCTGARALAKVWRVLERWMISIPAVSFNGGRYDPQLIRPYVAHNYGAQEPPWLHCFHIYKRPAPLMPTAASPANDDDRNEMLSILKKGLIALYTRRLVFSDVCTAPRACSTRSAR